MRRFVLFDQYGALVELLEKLIEHCLEIRFRNIVDHIDKCIFMPQCSVIVCPAASCGELCVTSEMSCAYLLRQHRTMTVRH